MTLLEIPWGASRQMTDKPEHWQLLGVSFVFVMFLASGIAHFALLDLFTSLVPHYVPFPRQVVMATGACEVAGAFALPFKPLRRITGWACALYLLCVLPVHIDMLIHADRWQFLGTAFLWIRPFFQPVLIAIVLLSTEPLRSER